MTMTASLPLPPRPGIKRRPEPEAGGAFADVVGELADRGRLSQRQIAAAGRFLADLTAYHGSSGVAGYGETVQNSIRMEKIAGEPTPVFKLRGWTEAHIRAQAVLDALWRHERETLDYLVTRRERVRGSLADFGRHVSGYAEQSQAVAAATARIQGLLDSIAEHYRV